MSDSWADRQTVNKLAFRRPERLEVADVRQFDKSVNCIDQAKQIETNECVLTSQITATNVLPRY
jgi:hypothetical protein